MLRLTQLVLITAIWSLPLALHSGCAWQRGPSATPLALAKEDSAGPHGFVCDQLIVHADFPLDRQHPLLHELLALRGTITTQLEIPLTVEPIHVYLYQSPAGYQRQSARYFPAAQTRRAFFVKNGDRRNVYAHWGGSAATDLRHELTHGYLHASLATLPLWLDEGLAEYFELPSSAAGHHAEHIALLRGERERNGWTPDLARLEAISAAGELTQLDYAESWLWTHWLLAPEAPERNRLLKDYLADARLYNSADPLSLRLRKQLVAPQSDLIAHFQSLADP